MIAMRIVGYGIVEKFGESGVRQLLGAWAGRNPWRYIEAGGLDEVKEIVAGISNESILLLFHGDARRWSTSFLPLHTRRRELYVLFVSTAPTAEEVGQMGLERTCGLDFGFRSIGAWDGHPPSHRRRMSDFVQSAADPKCTVPDWRRLDLPKIPEHVIACYFAALAGRSGELISDDWKEQFEDEVACLRRGNERGIGAGRLTWNDRGNASRIGGFLREAYLLEGSM